MKRMLTGPFEFAPHRPWTPERRAAASVRAKRAVAIITSRTFSPIWATPELSEIDYKFYFRLGTRVRVNETFPYGNNLGKTGTIRRLASGRHKWLGVEFDDDEKPGRLAKWHRSYFDPV